MLTNYRYFDAMYIDPLVDKLCEQNMLYSKADKNNLKYDLKVAKEEIEKCVKEELYLSLNSKTQIGRLKNGINFL